MISARLVLWILIFFGYALNAMLTININISIVAMVQSSLKHENADIHSRECSHIDHQNITKINNAREIYDNKSQNDESFNWNEHEQNLILGSFYWLYWPFPIVGGLLTQRYGTKLVFGISNFVSCFLAIFIPFAAHWNIGALIFIRILQGIICSPVWSSIHNLVCNWIPPTERSRFFSSTSGYSFGCAATYFLSSELIHLFGWPSVFYFTGACSVVWYIAWVLLVYDTPSQHPRISKSEFEYIKKSIELTERKKTFQIPWKHVLLSLPVWINILAMWGITWVQVVFLVHIPTYFNEIHGWSIRMNGLLSGVPHLLRMSFSYSSSLFFDYLLKRRIMSLTGIRKLATTICCIGQGALIIVIAFAGCNKTIVIVCMMIAVTFSGTFSSGPMASYADLSPNYSSVLMGLNLMVTMTTGFICPPIVAILTYENQSTTQWQIIFILSAAVVISLGIVHLLFASSEVQKWNSLAHSQNQLKEHAVVKNMRTSQPLLNILKDKSDETEALEDT